jgi:hypothetical protein
MSQWDQVKEIKGLIAGLAALVTVLIVIGSALMEWRVKVNVSAALAQQDIATDTKIISMDDEIDSNGAQGVANKDNIEDNERRVEQAFAVLLGRDPDDISN